jgi:hypothetical protein
LVRRAGIGMFQDSSLIVVRSYSLPLEPPPC